MRFSSTKSFAAVFLAGSLLGGAVTAFGSSVLGSNIFPDVPSDSYYNKAVGEMYSDGVIKGAPDGKFHPGDSVTRADIAVMLQRFKDSLESTTVVRSSSSRSSASSESSSSSSSSVAASVASVATNPQGIFRFTASTFQANKNSGSATISIVRTGGNQGSVSVDYSVDNGTATAGQDFAATAGTLSFANKETSKTFTITVLNNTSVSGNRTATITLKNAKNGALIASPGTATLTIVDPNAASSSSSTSAASSTSSNPNGTLSLASPTYGFLESIGTITITVNRAGGTSGAVGVNYATTNGSGVSGADYSGVSGTLTFGAGETNKTFTISVPDDSNVDGAKTFNIVLSNPTGGANLDTATALATIYDNESTTDFGSGSLKVSKASFDVSEGDKKVLMTVQRVGGSKGTISVEYQTVNGSSISGSDYTTTNGTLIFAPGETSKVITIPIVKDSASEENEYFFFNLLNPSGNTTLTSPSSATINIFD